jgi:hypothetical protein
MSQRTPIEQQATKRKKQDAKKYKKAEVNDNPADGSCDGHGTIQPTFDSSSFGTRAAGSGGERT